MYVFDTEMLMTVPLTSTSLTFTAPSEVNAVLQHIRFTVIGSYWTSYIKISVNALTPQLTHIPLHLLVSLFGPFQRVQAFLQVLQSLFSLLQSLLQLHPRLYLCLRHTERH